ncbi:MAG: nucleotidyltransferase domain-containing protein [Candidatus Hydrogenedentota bacterium]|jgi:uncharacterized protein
MAESSVIGKLRQYLEVLPKYGIHASRVVLYGSFARDATRAWSDIDVVVIAPEFDKPYDIALVEQLWIATRDADERIEPIPCGEREWETDDGRPILEIARREGIEVAV